MLRVGLIGAGLMGTIHARLLATSVPGAEVTAVSDADPGRAARLAGGAGAARVVADPLAVIADPAIDAVIVASPGDTHERFALACLEAGRPVLCEKPLATSAAAARRVVDAEAALGRRLVQVGFMRRFDPGYADLKRALDAGRIGAPLVVHSVHRNARVGASFDSEAILRDTVVHDVDTARWLLGAEVVRATVHLPRASRLAPEGVRDPQVIVLETDTGVVVTVEAFVNAQYGYDIRCEVVGETGTLTLVPPASVEVRAGGRSSTGVAAGFEDRFAAAYREELQAWVAAVGTGAAAGASAWDGHVAVAVGEAAYASLRSGASEVVRPGPRPALYEAPAAGDRADGEIPRAAR